LNMTAVLPIGNYIAVLKGIDEWLLC
jgi:hypothetical protein